MQRAAIISLASFVWLAGCSVNPVTGDRDFILLSGQQEVAMGIQNYVPMQQSQGGVYDVDPALTAYVESVGQKLAAVSDVPLPYEFVVLNNSVPNAWALPGGKIAINRGLLTELKSESELAAVLGHEVVHAAARHSAQQMSRGMLTQGLVVATTVATNDSSYRDLAAMGAGLAGQLALSKYGRSAELESDKYGMRYMSAAGYDPQGAVTLQETFVRLSEGRDQDWLSGLFASHPPSQERVDENRRRAGNLPAGGILGVESFNAAMRKTMAAKPAYDIYDNGRKALGEKKNDEALALANEALTLFPDEAHFHALRGDVRLMNKQFDMAVTARNELGQTDGAVGDLERSLELMPTAPAHYTLGEIKEQRGQTSEAIEHYKVVASSEGEYGKAAYGALVRLELPTQPAAYISSACGDDGSGQVVVQVRNDTQVTVQGVRAQFQYVDTGGTQRQSTQSFSGQLAPGKIGSARTGLAPAPGTRCAVAVTAAEIAN
jgi:predicted Zn-dependent protease